MTTIYIEKVIETAEEAEALPVGTVSPDGDTTDVKTLTGEWVSVWEVEDGDPSCYSISPNSHMVGRTALVPVEAEEEWTSRVQGFAGVFHVSASTGSFPTPQTRLTTPWREA